ncbi:MAG: hypothetical protein PHE55_16505 [Methylococcaceae bacterium]|nr:hypothetical protein [Methylococcaceae bacterium]
MPKQIAGKFYGLAVLTAMVGLPAIAAANSVTNPGFELGGFTGWTTSAPAFGIGVDNNSSDVHSGIYGVYFGSNPGNPTTASILNQQIATTVGQQYALTFWLSEYQADDLGGFFTASMGGNLLVNLIDVAQQDFTRYTANFTASSTTTLLEFQALNLPGFFGLDDVSVIPTTSSPVSAPATVLNLLAGLLALGQSLRQRKS